MNVRLTLILIIVVFSATLITAQTNRISKKNADCLNAIILDSIYGPTNPPIGHGEILDIYDNPLYNMHYFTLEHNTVWYIYSSKSEYPISLDIIPLNKNDDYDFLVFEYSDTSTCRLIKDKKILPVRTNISRVDKRIEGRTGLSDTAKQLYIKAGIGNPYSKYIDNTVEGQKYVIVLDNVYKNGNGHTIIVKQKPKIKDIKQEIIVGDEDTINLNYKFQIACFEAKTKEPIDCEILVKNNNNKDTIAYKREANTLNIETNKRRVYISGTKTGYMYKHNLVNAKEINGKIYRIELDKIVKGNKLVIDNIYFHGNKATIIPSSITALEQLYNFLKENEDLKIEIQGHVNGTSNGHRFYQPLSDDRANAIKDYLIQNGIDKNRLSAKGYSNKFMIYPNPISEIESSKNRRVEILILE